MSLKHGLLGLLNYGSMTGYELDKAFKESLRFFWQAKSSQIYRELDAMEKKGWLKSQRVVQTEKPNKRVYTITDEGKAELSQWLSLPEVDISNAMHGKNAFLMRVFFAGETSIEQSLEMLRSYRQKCIESKDILQNAYISSARFGEQQSYDKRTKFWNMSILYGETFYEANLSWVDKVIRMLEEDLG